MIPQEHLNPFKSFVDNYMTSRMSVSFPPEAEKNPLNTKALVNSIATNETGGVKTDPYSFYQPSGSKTQGNALGKYQVTSGELKTYGTRFGTPVDDNTFLSNPGVQDTYMRNKIDYLHNTFGWTADQIMAAHRGGFGNPANIQKTMKKYAPYVQKGMLNYNGQNTTASNNQ